MDTIRNIKKWVHKNSDPVVTRLIPWELRSGENRNDRLGAFTRAWLHIFTNQIRGAYYEFGVYLGNGFRTSYQAYQGFAVSLHERLSSPEKWRRDQAAAYIDWKHAFYAFDTFEGMPRNDEGNEIFAEATFRGTLEHFRDANAAIGLSEGEHVKYFKGLFSETARKEQKELGDLQAAAIVNVDCDLYLSAIDALNIVAPKLQQGTILLMDDWNCFSASRDKGERRALREFLEKHPAIEVESWFPYSEAGQAFIVHCQS